MRGDRGDAGGGRRLGRGPGRAPALESHRRLDGRGAPRGTGAGDHPDPSSFVADFAGDDRAISDYLLSEVMSRLSPENRSFLLRTSIAGPGQRRSRRRADRPRRRPLPAALARGRRALLAPLDWRGNWYRYHALFRELLMAELRSEAPDVVPALHRRAARGSPITATRLAASCTRSRPSPWDLAARLAAERWVDLLTRGDVGALEPLIERLPRRVGRGGSGARAGGRERAAGPRRSCRGRRSCSARPGRRGSRAARARARASPCPSPRSGSTSRGCAGISRRDRVGAGAVCARGSSTARSVDAGLRALALVHLGIAELWAGEAERPSTISSVPAGRRPRRAATGSS